MPKWFTGGDPFYVKFWVKLAALKRNFRSIFSRGASAVTTSEKSSMNTNRKSTTLFPMRTRWTLYVVPKPPSPEGVQKRKLSKIWTIGLICDNSKTVRYMVWFYYTIHHVRHKDTLCSQLHNTDTQCRSRTTVNISDLVRHNICQSESTSYAGWRNRPIVLTVRMDILQYH